MATKAVKETPKKSSGKKWLLVGEIRLAKDGKTKYIHIPEDVELKAGSALFLKKKADEIGSQVEKEFITEERGEELKEKLSFITHSIYLPPPRDED